MEMIRFSQISPFTQITIGATKAGEIGRFMAGAEISPYPSIAFIVGVEGSLLRFHHNDYKFLSNKVGINFGAKLKL